ncbi:phasin family protein [Thioclava sp.]|uniref:phasin family protein n=1 Tax=Thioclava sp. TaxID=1933450 RepID=UPI003AA8FAD2
MATPKSPTSKKMAGSMQMPDAASVSQMMAPHLHMAEKLIAQNIEMLDFLKARFERDRQMLGKLTEQRDPMKAMNLWGEFWQCTMTDYSTQMTKLATSASGLAEQAVRAATEESEAITQAASGKASSTTGKSGVSLTDVPV